METACIAMGSKTVATQTRVADRSDAELIVMTLDGRQDAFGVIVERYRAKAVRVAASMVGDLEIARDLTQDSFLKAYRALNTFDIKSPFLPWFYRILKNTCRDNLRRKGRFRKVIERLKPSVVDRGNLWDEVSTSDTVDVVRKAVSALRDKDREIIELRHFSGLSYDEIAEILRVPRGTVMSRLHYARKALHDILVNQFHVRAGDL